MVGIWSKSCGKNPTARMIILFGAINAAIAAGNAIEDRVDKLEQILAPGMGRWQTCRNPFPVAR